MFASPEEAEERGLDFGNLRQAIDASEAAWKEDGLECEEDDDDDDEEEEEEDLLGDGGDGEVRGRESFLRLARACSQHLQTQPRRGVDALIVSGAWAAGWGDGD